MQQAINALLIGISNGFIYSLMALALVLVWRSTRVINFAQAGQAILSTYIAFEIVTRTDNFILAFIGGVIAGALVGAVVEILLMRTLFKHVSDGPVAALAPVIASLGLLGLIRSIIGMVWGNDQKPFFPPVSTKGFTFGETNHVPVGIFCYLGSMYSARAACCTFVQSAFHAHVHIILLADHLLLFLHFKLS